MEWRQWINQTLPRTEQMRGGATVWPSGASGLLGDSLGPVMHFHEDASEIFYFVAGSCRMEVGDTEQFFGPGDFILVPPGVPHNLWNGGDEDLLVFWIVAPHFPEHKWSTGIDSTFLSGRVLPAKVRPGAELPSNAQIYSRLLDLAEDKTLSEFTAAGQEAVVYIAGGEAEVQVGKLVGRLTENDFVHVPAGTRYRVTPAGGPAEVLIFRMPGLENA